MSFKFLAIPLAFIFSFACIIRTEIQAGEFYTSNSKADTVHFAQKVPAPSFAFNKEHPDGPCLTPFDPNGPCLTLYEPADTSNSQPVQKGSRAPRSHSRHRKPAPDPDSHSPKLAPADSVENAGQSCVSVSHTEGHASSLVDSTKYSKHLSYSHSQIHPPGLFFSPTAPDLPWESAPLKLW